MESAEATAITHVTIEKQVSFGDFLDVLIGLLSLLLFILVFYTLPDYLANTVLELTFPCELVTLAIMFVLVAFSFLYGVGHLTLEPEGIRLHRLLGNPRFLPWSDITGVDPADRWEVFSRGFMSLSSRLLASSFFFGGHVPIATAQETYYFPAANPADLLTYFRARRGSEPIASGSSADVGLNEASPASAILDPVPAIVPAPASGHPLLRLAGWLLVTCLGLHFCLFAVLQFLLHQSITEENRQSMARNLTNQWVFSPGVTGEGPVQELTITPFRAAFPPLRYAD